MSSWKLMQWLELYFFTIMEGFSRLKDNIFIFYAKVRKKLSILRGNIEAELERRWDTQ